MDAGELMNVLGAIYNNFNLSDDCEITIECNPGTMDEDKLGIYREKGVNRLSFGLQSVNDDELKMLGRIHSFEDFMESYEAAAKSGFDNINIDLIYGINNESMEELQEEVKNFIELDVNHISLYSLILEDNTILKTKKYEEINDDLNRKMYDYIRKTLKKNNYIHYEISNFSKKGYMSKHNLCYWNNDNYYGFGLGSSGFIENIRYTNTRSLNSYINGNYRYIKEKIDKNRNM